MKRLEGQPFVLLGVNTDSSREAISKVIEKEKLTWPSWWDGSTEGPIATLWQISHWPTFYVLDHKGVIRHIEAKGGTPDLEAIDAAIELLLKEASRQKEASRRKEALP